MLLMFVHDYYDIMHWKYQPFNLTLKSSPGKIKLHQGQAQRSKPNVGPRPNIVGVELREQSL